MSAFTQLMQREQERQERRIPEMDLDEVREMLCQLHGKDPYYCVNCKGIKGCPAGKRAVELIEDMTKSTETEKPEGIYNKSAAIEFAKKLAGMDDPVSYLVETSSNYHSAVGRVRGFKQRYPEIMKDIELPDRSTSNIGASQTIMLTVLSKDDPVEYLLKRYHIPRVRGREIVEEARKKFKEPKEEKMEQMDDQLDGQMSVSDFIASVEQAPEPETEEQLTDAAVEEPAVPDDIHGELNTKFYEILQKEAEIRNQIKELEDRLAWLEKAKDALAMVSNLFNPNSAIGKLPFTE